MTFIPLINTYQLYKISFLILIMPYNNQNSCNNSIQITPDSNTVLRITNNTKKSIRVADVVSGQLFRIESNCTFDIKNLNGRPITKISVLRNVDCGKKCKGCNSVSIQNLASTSINISDPRLNGTRALPLAGNATTNISNNITNNCEQICAAIALIIIDSSGSSIGDVNPLPQPQIGTITISSAPSTPTITPVTYNLQGSLTLAPSTGFLSGSLIGSVSQFDVIQVTFSPTSNNVSANLSPQSALTPTIGNNLLIGTYRVIPLSSSAFSWVITPLATPFLIAGRGQTSI